MNPIQYQQMVRNRIYQSITNKEECFEDYLTKAHQDKAEDDAEYKKKVKELLKKYGVDEITDLTKQQKKEFFSKLDASHTSEKEVKKQKKELKEYREELKKAYDILDIGIEKARSGVYQNTPENRKLGRVGQRYGPQKEQDSKKKI